MTEKIKDDIRHYDLAELEQYFLKTGEKKFRAKQVYEWIWKKGAQSIDEMSNLSVPLRKKINTDFNIFPAIHTGTYYSNDYTQKLIFQLKDKLFVESVLIPSSDRSTACISSQTGCQLGCKFCASSKIKNVRNLSVGEIYDQITSLNKQSIKEFGKALTNIVFMGIGEPFLNYDNVKRSILILTSEQGLNMSPSRITISTAGITDIIKKFTDDHLKVNLAISLHAADEQKRDNIMPINKSNPLKELKDAIANYNKKCKSMVTLEYLLLQQYNDSLNDAKDLVKFCKNLYVKVNLIEYNQIEKSSYRRSSKERTNTFKSFLENKNIITTIRNSKGSEISAACGQLSNSLNTEILQIKNQQ